MVPFIRVLILPLKKSSRNTRSLSTRRNNDMITKGPPTFLSFFSTFRSLGLKAIGGLLVCRGKKDHGGLRRTIFECLQSPPKMYRIK